jgi:hypothetical protein
LAKSVKLGGPIYLGHTNLAASIRPYPGFGVIWEMIARTAFTQLRCSPVLLAATIVGMAFIWLLPFYCALFGAGWVRLTGCAASVLALVSYMPTLRRYERSVAWSVLLPLIAVFYVSATVGSAVNHWRGTGAKWKARAYAQRDDAR